MHKAERLFRIVLLLRRNRVTTAAELADTLEVSERTIYRDMLGMPKTTSPRVSPSTPRITAAP